MTRSARGHRAAETTKKAHANQRSTRGNRAKAIDPESNSGPGWQKFLRDQSVRSRVAALVILPLLVVLIFGFVLFTNALSGSSASEAKRLADVGSVAATALARLQDERDISGLAESGGTGAGAVNDARGKTDEALNALDQKLDELSKDDLSPVVSSTLTTYEQEKGKLQDYRTQRDNKSPAYDAGGTDGYHRLANAIQGIITAPSAVASNPTIASNTAALGDLTDLAESASIERGLVAYAIQTGEPVAPTQRDKAMGLNAEQAWILEQLGNRENVAGSEELNADQADITAVRQAITAAGPIQQTKQQWYDASSQHLEKLRASQDSAITAITDEASNVASESRKNSIITALIVVAVLAITIYLTFVVARSIVGPLRRLRASAALTTEKRLPDLVKKIQTDGPASVRDDEQAVHVEGKDEIAQVATAFNDVHSTAVTVTSQQALLRQNLDTIVVNLSRRTQSLVERQLSEIESLEQRESDPDQLSTLFTIDHMATRVRRHAESLLVLAGVDDMRKHHEPAPVLDVIRTAVGEVEQYPRVKFGVMPADFVASEAVDDIAHLLAELIDNATEFSAPATAVNVTSQPLLGGGLRIQVADAGLGIPTEQLAELNARLQDAGDIDVATSRTLGLYVVSRLAAKHDISVQLEPAPDGGTAAQVDLPSRLILSSLDTADSIPVVTPETETPAPAATPLTPSTPFATLSGPSEPFRSSFTDVPATPEPTPQTPTQPISPAQPVAQTQPVAQAQPTHQAANSPLSDDTDSPIFDSVRSAWFRESNTDHDWSSPADAGWQRAAEALRSAELAANARRGQHSRPSESATTPPSRTPRTSWTNTPEPVVATPTAMNSPRTETAAPAPEPVVSSAGLPMRQRGASLVPGSIGDAAQAVTSQSSAVTDGKSADTVASTLSSLQRGVGKGREETGGWVPRKPNDSERSNT